MRDDQLHNEIVEMFNDLTEKSIESGGWPVSLSICKNQTSSDDLCDKSDGVIFSPVARGQETLLQRRRRHRRNKLEDNIRSRNYYIRYRARLLAKAKARYWSGGRKPIYKKHESTNTQT